MTYGSPSWIAVALLGPDAARLVVAVHARTISCPTTAGPFGGIGGRAFSDFTITALVLRGGDVLFFVDEKFVGWDSPYVLDDCTYPALALERLVSHGEFEVAGLQPPETSPVVVTRPHWEGARPMTHNAENDAWAALEAVREVLCSVDINSLGGQEFERMWAMDKIVNRALATRPTPPAECAEGGYCAVEDGVVVRVDDGCPTHSLRPGTRVTPPAEESPMPETLTDRLDAILAEHADCGLDATHGTDSPSIRLTCGITVDRPAPDSTRGWVDIHREHVAQALAATAEEAPAPGGAVEDDAADPRVQIERIGDDWNLFRVTINGTLVDDWATGDEVLGYVSDALSAYVTEEAPDA